MKWISTKEALPILEKTDNNSREVLITDGKFIYVGYLCTSILTEYIFWLQDSNKFYLIDGKITHWMELPNLPGKDEEDFIFETLGGAINEI